MAKTLNKRICNAYFYTGEDTIILTNIFGHAVDLDITQDEFCDLLADAPEVCKKAQEFLEKYGSNFDGYDIMPEGLYEARRDYERGILNEDSPRYLEHANDTFWVVQGDLDTMERDTGFWWV